MTGQERCTCGHKLVEHAGDLEHREGRFSCFCGCEAFTEDSMAGRHLESVDDSV